MAEYHVGCGAFGIYAGTFGGYKWTLKDGRVVKLLVAIENGGDNDAAD